MNKHKDQVIQLLKVTNPPAVSGGGEYLERPNNGWIIGEGSFTGVGYHGNETGDYDTPWKASAAGSGHIPSGGYG